MTFIVQTQINIVFNDRQSEFDGFEPLTVGLTLRIDLNFRDQMFHQLFAFKGIHNIVELFKTDENLVSAAFHGLDTDVLTLNLSDSRQDRNHQFASVFRRINAILHAN